MSRHARVAALIAAASTLVPTAAAWAQVEEIVVTTRRKAESLQDVPIAVSAITSEQIQRQGISDIDDIVKLNPSVQFDRSFGPADTRVTLRGLSNTRGRSNVAFLVDGVDVTTENLNAAGSGLLVNQRLLSDIERVEVVKGPQSALYGRAAFAGAINYITKSPALDAWDGNVNWTLGDYGQKQFDFAVGGPVVGDVFGVRLSSVYWEEDGFYDNSVSGEPVGDTEGYALALTSLWAPNDVTEFKLRLEYSDEEYGPLPNIRVGGGRSGVNMELKEYPQSALDAGLGQNQNRPNSTSTALVDFGQYCPPELLDPSRGPGYCLPTTFGTAQDIYDAGFDVTHSRDADSLSGKDYPGTNIENFRASLQASFDIESLGTVTSITGYTDSDADDAYDQDWQAPERTGYEAFIPTDNGAGDLAEQIAILSQAGTVAAQQAKSRVNTRQFSQELRFQSDLEGPVQFTVGSLYWDEKRDFEDQTFIIFCAPGRFDVPNNRVRYFSGYCDGTPAANNPGFQTIDNWFDYRQQLRPAPWINWIAETQHWSFYGVLEWEITEELTLSFEERFVDERFTFQKPAFSSCTSFGGPNPGGAALEVEQVDPVTGEIINDARCTADIVLDPNVAISSVGFSPSLGTAVGWRYQEASQDSHFNTPRVILQWLPTDDAQIYFSWARAQKPGGIATTPGGGSPVSIQDDRFEPEKMEAWEIGTKTNWEAAGALQLNMAGFFQDYTDKQIGTQRIVDNFLQPIIINASAAEVWGFELEALWAPDFADGLTLNLAWTYLDATYSDFVDETTSVQRAANAGSCPVVTDELGNNKCALDFSGNQLERTPEHALVLGGNYTRQFLDSDFDWFAEFTASYQDERFLEADNGLFFDDYWLVDLRGGLTGENWDILVFVDNVFDDDTIKSGGSGPDFGPQVVETGFTAGFGVTHFFATLPPPRVVGLRASYRFGL